MGVYGCWETMSHTHTFLPSGLDPAEPYFQDTNALVRLDPTDAKFVDVIHTDASPFVPNLGECCSLSYYVLTWFTMLSACPVTYTVPIEILQDLE